MPAGLTPGGAGVGTKLLYGRCRVDYMSHHHHDGGEIPFFPLDDAL